MIHEIENRQSRTVPVVNSDFEIVRHQIFDRVFQFLQNRRIRFSETGTEIYKIFHEKTRRVLSKIDGMTETEIDALENSVFNDAEKMRGVEVVTDAPSALYYELKKSGDLDLIYRKRAVAVPNFILNALICAELEKEFGRENLLHCDGFIEDENSVRLDLDERLCRRGFLLPEYNSNTFLIQNIRVFRYPTDERSFLLRSRQKFNSGRFIN